MSVQYQAIGWNRQKRIYDLVLLAGVLGYLGIFVGIGAALHRSATIETLLIRGLGTSAFLLLHVVLCIGPLCRLSSAFLPLLYNRRHLGVTTFLLGLGHGVFALIQFHALGNKNPLSSLFISNTRFGSFPDFPFQSLGFFALVILYIMAATSHDFWLHTFTAPTWKRMHMLVYLAYALLVGHVALGALQSETSPIFSGIVVLGVATVLSLHLLAARREQKADTLKLQAARDGFVNACELARIPEDRAVIIPLHGERVAIFKYGDKISAVSNVCQHQNGPLGEGRIIDGCITCPWHGYQYLPESGASPAPFKEKVPTFCTRIVDGHVWVNPQPNAPGTFVEASQVPKTSAGVRAR
jgi:methionine sulfoxide reductase heme-binding subunit